MTPAGNSESDHFKILICRILEFVHVFLEAVLSGEEDLVKCANKAYEDVLKRYHGWIIRGIFHVRL